MARLVFIIATFFILSSCYKELYPYDKKGLTNKGKANYLNQFKMNGFFESKQRDSTIFLRYFFENGYSSSTSTGSNSFGSGTCPQIENIREVPQAWGVYTILNDTISIQTINSSRGALNKFRIVEEKIAILNDSTLHWFKMIMPSKEVIKKDVLYKFHFCATKPKSTNILMQESEKGK